MQRLTFAFLVTTMAWNVYAQPPACSEDVHCVEGYYCVLATKFCAPCLKCEDVKKHPPSTQTSCVTSYTDCGDCMEGFVQQVSDDFCKSEEILYPPSYIWILISSVILIAIVGAIVLYKFLRKRTIAQRHDVVESLRKEPMPPSAPECPPSYDQINPDAYRYTNVDAEQPRLYNGHSRGENGMPLHTYIEESEQPLVSRGPEGKARPGSLQNDGIQATRPFHDPNWIRNSMICRDTEDINGNDQEDRREYERDVPMPDLEDTVPSPWVPSSETNGNSDRTNTNTEDRVETRDDVEEIQNPPTSVGAVISRPFANLSPPPAKMMRGIPTKTDDAGEGSSSGESSGTNFAGPRMHQTNNGAQVIVNVANYFEYTRNELDPSSIRTSRH